MSAPSDEAASEQSTEAAEASEASEAPSGDASMTAPAAASGEGTDLAALLEQEGEIAADYLEALLDIADLDGDLDMDVEGERALVSIVGASLDQLVGDRGEVLEALQELTRQAVYRRTGVRSRLMLDISGWRAQRRADLIDLGQRTAEQVRDSGEPASLDPMTPFERKAVHDAVADVDGVESGSEGEEPNRYVILRPASG